MPPPTPPQRWRRGKRGCAPTRYDHLHRSAHDRGRARGRRLADQPLQPMTLPSYPCLNAAVDRDCPQTPTYPARECTSGGSWWGSRYTGKPWPQGWGNADNWPAAARAARFNVTIQPSANSIMCIPPNTNGAGPKGHIAYLIGLAGPMAQVWEMKFLIEYGFDYR